MSDYKDWWPHYHYPGYVGVGKRSRWQRLKDWLLG